MYSTHCSEVGCLVHSCGHTLDLLYHDCVDFVVDVKCIIQIDEHVADSQSARTAVDHRFLLREMTVFLNI